MNSFKDVKLRRRINLTGIHIFEMMGRAENVFSREYSVQLDM